jgi:Asp/Glu/hydantoin racemase
MTIKYAYCVFITREYKYVNTREELIECLINEVVTVYLTNYTNNEPFAIVEIDSDGMEKWYTPTGEERLTAEEIKAKIKQSQSFINAGEIPVSLL